MTSSNVIPECLPWPFIVLDTKLLCADLHPQFTLAAQILRREKGVYLHHTLGIKWIELFVQSESLRRNKQCILYVICMSFALKHETWSWYIYIYIYVYVYRYRSKHLRYTIEGYTVYIDMYTLFHPQIDMRCNYYPCHNFIDCRTSARKKITSHPNKFYVIIYSCPSLR